MPAVLPSTSGAHLFNVPHLEVAAGGCSVQALDHDHNEDCEYISPQHDLFIVADGMGSHRAGEAASQFAVDTLNHELGRIQNEAHTAAEVKQIVRAALGDAHCLILEMGDLVPACHGGDAAVVLALLFGERLYVSGVGDSRAYLLRDGVLEQLTHDDAPTLEMDRTTRHKNDEDGHRLRPHLLSELDMKEFRSKQDIRILDLRPGDRFLLCTDGLTDSVNDNDIGRVLAKQRNPRHTAFDLVRLAVDNDAKDDVTALVFTVSEVVVQSNDIELAPGLGRWQQFVRKVFRGIRVRPVAQA